jgi:hypothetical protein
MTDATWPPTARAILDRACERHGGWGRWRRLEQIRLELGHFSGLLPSLKGLGRTFPAFRTATISPATGVTIFHAFPDDEATTIYERGAVRTLSRATGAVLADSPRHRETFRGSRRRRRWSAIDAAYFFGYALAHYHSVPFTLGASAFAGLRHGVVNGRRCDAIAVEFPAGVETHCRRQTFWFDSDGLLLRHDYVADVVGPTARGAHLWLEYREIDGWPIAMHRRVVARLGRMAIGPTVLDAQFAGAAIDWRPAVTPPPGRRARERD